MGIVGHTGLCQDVELVIGRIGREVTGIRPSSLRGETGQHTGLRRSPCHAAVGRELRRPRTGGVTIGTGIVIVALHLQTPVGRSGVRKSGRRYRHVKSQGQKRHVMLDIAVAHPGIHGLIRQGGARKVFQQITFVGNDFARKVECIARRRRAVAFAKLEFRYGHRRFPIRADQRHGARFDRTGQVAARFLPGVGHLAGESQQFSRRGYVLHHQDRIPVAFDQILAIARGAYPLRVRHRDRVFDIASGIFPRLGGREVTAALHARDPEGIMRIGFDVEVFVRSIARDRGRRELPGEIQPVVLFRIGRIGSA